MLLAVECVNTANWIVCTSAASWRVSVLLAAECVSVLPAEKYVSATSYSVCVSAASCKVCVSCRMCICAASCSVCVRGASVSVCIQTPGREVCASVSVLQSVGRVSAQVTSSLHAGRAVPLAVGKAPCFYKVLRFPRQQCKSRLVFIFSATRFTSRTERLLSLTALQMNPLPSTETGDDNTDDSSVLA